MIAYRFMHMFLPVIGAMFILSSCDNKPEISTKEEKPVEEVPNEKDDFGDMPFEKFFEKFKSDNNFQFSRILFPLKMTYDEIGLESGDVTVIEETLQKSEWLFSSFSPDESNEKVEYKIVRQGFNVTIEMRGIDSGIAVDYIFEDLDGKWFLVSVEDHSM